jgi:hypothetical protein
MTTRIAWRGPAVAAEVAARVTTALDRFDLQIEAGAKAELYPGHGKITGVLQRSIGIKPAQRQGLRIVGGVATRGVPYARLIHRRYEYLSAGLRKAGSFSL